jgi:hypothetical protein
VFTIVLGCIGASIWVDGFSSWIVAPPLALFVILVVFHDRVIRRRDRLVRTVEFHKQGLRRIEDEWMGHGVPGTRFTDAEHPYAVDLDLFGRGSLFELLCTARTRSGEERLAGWLLKNASPDTIRSRQAAVTELRDRLDLREQLAILGEEARASADPNTLSVWGSQPPRTFPIAIRIAALLLALANLVTAGFWITGIASLPFYAAVGITVIFDSVLWPRIRPIVRSIDTVGRDLGLTAALLARIESTEFESPLLAQLKHGLRASGRPPSARIRELRGLIAYLDFRRNMVIAPLGFLLCWTTQISFTIENWRRKFGPHLEQWINAISEIEALSAFAAYSFEHPADCFPEIADGPACFKAQRMTHPLLPAAGAVRNDVTIDSKRRLLIVSGSNMSGKSTLLRTIGVNAVMALAGAPVRADSLRISPVELGASIILFDSLQGGTSRFYAEIKRLKQIVDIASDRPPLLFLLDEILHGTNSHDRLIGAEAIVRALIARGAIGLVTTHDLALARMSEDRELEAVNVHFQDELIDGTMVFDYKLQPGVVEHSNAIALMRAVGLEV